MFTKAKVGNFFDCPNLKAEKYIFCNSFFIVGQHFFNKTVIILLIIMQKGNAKGCQANWCHAACMAVCSCECL